MRVYFAGSGMKIENEKDTFPQKPNWGILLTYKDFANSVKNNGNKRFQEFIKSKKNGNGLKKR